MHALFSIVMFPVNLVIHIVLAIGMDLVALALLALAEIVLFIDLIQTLWIARNPTIETEINKIMGPHPSVTKVYTYFGAWLVGTPIVAFILWMIGLQWLSLAGLLILFVFELYITLRNVKLGIPTSLKCLYTNVPLPTSIPTGSTTDILKNVVEDVTQQVETDVSDVEKKVEPAPAPAASTTVPVGPAPVVPTPPATDAPKA